MQVVVLSNRQVVETVCNAVHVASALDEQSIDVIGNSGFQNQTRRAARIGIDRNSHSLRRRRARHDVNQHERRI